MKATQLIRKWLPLSCLLLWMVGGPSSLPAAPKMRTDKLSQIDKTIGAAITDGDIPGAVLWVESKGEVYTKAYGLRMKDPSFEKMTPDTIFDLASLTKVLATTPAILHLYERGKIQINAPVSDYIPEFLEGGILEEAEPDPPKDGKEPEFDPGQVTPEHRKEITIRHLMTHQSGLPPGIFISKQDFWGHEEGVRRAISIGLKEKPGTRFRYSDVNFILLGEIVRRASGQRVDGYVHDHFYEPLGMADTGYLPPRFRQPRIAPTTFIKEYGLIRGEVHDPTARRMNEVAGHAGLFSTAPDIAKFMRMFLNGGSLESISCLQAETIAFATENHLPDSIGYKRGLGWDIGSNFAYQRGERFPKTGFGHTGWTGTSIWADPASESFVILLANRNHPTESGRIKQLRIKVGTLAGEAVGYTRAVPLSDSGTEDYSRNDEQTAAAAAGSTVLNGIDVLEKENFQSLAGRKVGLITNHTGINRNRRSTIDLLAAAKNVSLVALFSPEHGIRGTLDTDSISDGKDDATGLPVYSLYKSKERKPTASQLKGIDTLVFDIQDIGCRFYTYISTMGLAMEAAAENKLKIVVLDRVNPIGGVIVDGPVRTGKGNDFVAFHDIPVQHGMTAGELARMFNAERKINADLQVIPVRGWDPASRFDETGLPWVNPSPNMRSITEALLYPGIGLLEFTNISVGRGTATPFEHIGAPWIDDGRLAARLIEDRLPGILILPTRYTPDANVYDGEDCGGVRFLITDRNTLRPIDVGLSIGRAIQESYPRTFNLKDKGNVLLRHSKTLDALVKGKSNQQIRNLWKPDLEKFLKRRSNFLLYSR